MRNKLPRYSIGVTLTEDEVTRLDEMCMTASKVEGRTIHHPDIILRGLAMYDNSERGNTGKSDSVFIRKDTP